MRAADLAGALQVGQGTRHLEQAMGCPQRQVEAFAGLLQPQPVGFGQATMLLQARQIEEGIGAALPRELALACLADAGGDLGAALASLAAGQQAGAFARHGEVQVDAVEQRPGQLGAVALDLFRGAAAAAAGVAQVATGTGVHRRHQLEARREAHLVAGPGDHDMAGLQRLAQDLEDLAVELGQLVEEQDAVMGQADLAGLRAAAATVSSIRKC